MLRRWGYGEHEDPMGGDGPGMGNHAVRHGKRGSGTGRRGGASRSDETRNCLEVSLLRVFRIRFASFGA